VSVISVMVVCPTRRARGQGKTHLADFVFGHRACDVAFVLEDEQ
jgi:hypothetical protein